MIIESTISPGTMDTVVKPFLDHRLVEYVFTLPGEQKIKDGLSKAIPREAMKGILPEEVRLRRDKMGFVTPEDRWFRTIAKDTIVEILNSSSFRERGYFEMDQTRQAFQDHCLGWRNISSTIWRWVNLELWLRMFIDA